MAVSRTTQGGFLSYASHPGNSVNVARCVWRRRCTGRQARTLHSRCRALIYTLYPQVNIHIPHHGIWLHYAIPLYHSLTQTKPHQINYFNNPNQRLLGSLSAYMHPADPLYMLSAHAKLTSSHPYVLCSYVVCCFRFQFLARVLLRLLSFRSVNSLFRRVSSSLKSMLLVGLSVCFSRFVCSSYTMGMSSFPLFFRVVLGSS